MTRSYSTHSTPSVDSDAISCFSSPVISVRRPGRSSYDIVEAWADGSGRVFAVLMQRLYNFK